jgi:hypothetical protein
MQFEIFSKWLNFIVRGSTVHLSGNKEHAIHARLLSTKKPVGHESTH